MSVHLITCYQSDEALGTAIGCDGLLLSIDRGAIYLITRDSTYAIGRFSLGFDAAELGQRSGRVSCSLQRAEVVNVSRCARVTQFVGVVGTAIVES